MSITKNWFWTSSSDTFIYTFLAFLTMITFEVTWGPFLQRLGNLLGPKSNSWNCDPLAVKTSSLNIFKIWGNCQVSKVETCSSWIYKANYVSRKVSGRSRNRSLDDLRSGPSCSKPYKAIYIYSFAVKGGFFTRLRFKEKKNVIYNLTGSQFCGKSSFSVK